MLDPNFRTASRILETSKSFLLLLGVLEFLSFDDATINITLGHYTRVFVDIDMASPLQDQILVEREGFTFLVGIEYEYITFFCNSCVVIGHSLSECKKHLNVNKENQKNDYKGALGNKKSMRKYVPKNNEENHDVLKTYLNKGKQVLVDQSPTDILGDSGKLNHDTDGNLDPEVQEIPVKVVNANSILPKDVSYVLEKIDSTQIHEEQQQPIMNEGSSSNNKDPVSKVQGIDQDDSSCDEEIVVEDSQEHPNKSAEIILETVENTISLEFPIIGHVLQPAEDSFFSGSHIVGNVMLQIWLCKLNGMIKMFLLCSRKISEFSQNFGIMRRWKFLAMIR